MGVAHCSQSPLACIELTQPAKLPVLCREEPAELYTSRNWRIHCGFSFREHHPSPTLELHSMRQQHITIPSLLRTAECSLLLFLPTSQKLWWVLVIEGHSSLFALNSCTAVPSPGLSSSIIAGNFIPVSCWALPLHAFELAFFSSLKGACNIYCMALESLD